MTAGCGGSDSKDNEPSASTPAGTTSTAAKPAITKAEFIAQADSACRSTQKKQNELRREAVGKKTSELVPTLRKQAKLARNLADDLAEITTPAGDATSVAAFIDSVRKIGIYSKALSDSIEAKHDKPASNLATKLVNWRQVEHTLGQSYGLKVCARGSSY
jgi:phage host-nuclease inhibitor protein Gam